MSDIKRYKVSFEVESHPKYSNEWLINNYDDGDFKELELPALFVTVPAYATIEDITPESEVPVGSSFNMGGYHYFKSKNGWVTISHVDPPSLGITSVWDDRELDAHWRDANG